MTSANIHYPEHTAKLESLKPDIKHNTADINKKYKDWVNVDRLTQVFRDFKSKKSLGPYGLKPIMLKQLPNNIIDYLIVIYKTIISTSYTPTLWKEARIFYLEKPGQIV